MTSLFKTKKKLLLIICFLSIFILLPLFLINMFFKIDLGIELLRAEWDANAAIGFYGCILASFIAIVGVFETLKLSKEINQEEKRVNCLPRLCMNILSLNLDVQNNSRIYMDSSAYRINDLMKNYESRKIIFEEYDLHDVFIVVDKKGIFYRKELDDEQLKIIKTHGMVRIADVPNQEFDYQYKTLKFKNVGNGAAIRVRYGLNREEISLSEKEFFSVGFIDKDSEFLIHIYAENIYEYEEVNGKYNFEIIYEDIYGTAYIQNYPVTISDDADHKSHLSVIPLDSIKIMSDIEIQSLQKIHLLR